MRRLVSWNTLANCLLLGGIALFALWPLVGSTLQSLWDALGGKGLFTSILNRIIFAFPIILSGIILSRQARKARQGTLNMRRARLAGIILLICAWPAGIVTIFLSIPFLLGGDAAEEDSIKLIIQWGVIGGFGLAGLAYLWQPFRQQPIATRFVEQPGSLSYTTAVVLSACFAGLAALAWAAAWNIAGPTNDASAGAGVSAVIIGFLFAIKALYYGSQWLGRRSG